MLFLLFFSRPPYPIYTVTPAYCEAIELHSMDGLLSVTRCIFVLWLCTTTCAVEVSDNRVLLLEQQVDNLTRRLQLLEQKWYEATLVNILRCFCARPAGGGPLQIFTLFNPLSVLRNRRFIEM